MTTVTAEGIRAKITKVEYHQIAGTTLTICIITVENGFAVTGESACADPRIFSKERGESEAYDVAFEKLWALEGYLLKEKLFRSSLTSRRHLRML